MQTIDELHNAYQALSEEEAKRKVSSKLKIEKDKIKDHAKLGIFKSKKGKPPVVFIPVTGSKIDAGTHSSNAHDLQLEESSTSDSASTAPTGSPMQRLQLALDSLRHQHTALTKSISTTSHLDSGTPASRGSPLLPTTAEEVMSSSPQSRHSTIGKLSSRMSAYSTHSDGSVWFDAPEYDGAEEFVLDAAPGEESQGSQLSYLESPSRTEEEEETTETESDSEEAEGETPHATILRPSLSRGLTVTRRTELPSPPVGDEGSLFTVLKKNVGKVRRRPLYAIEIFSIIAGFITSCPSGVIQRALDTFAKGGRRTGVSRSSFTSCAEQGSN